MYRASHYLNLLFILLLFSACTLEEDDPNNPADDRDKFLGIWNVTESCSKDAYQVSIEKDPTNSAQVLIYNFWLIGYQERPPYGIVAGNTLYIPKQYMCHDDSNEVSGDGDYYKEEITLSYSVNDGADLYNCTATYTRP
jgi:hypothetical protein